MKIAWIAAFALVCGALASGRAAASADQANVGNDAPLYVVVSRDDQNLTVYRGTEPVATSRVSTGKDGHVTPTGIYSILQKARFHRSNKYSNAPMPFMQRITWSGIALHASDSVPDRPASHGCVRMPPSFAQGLYKMTGLGAHVVITNGDKAPEQIDNPTLFQPVTLSASASGWAAGTVGELRDTIGRDAGEPTSLTGAAPIRILITRLTRRQMTRDTQRLLNKLGYDVGEVDGYIGPQTIAGIRAFQTMNGMRRTATVSKGLLADLYRIAGEGQAPLGHIYVRRNFEPVFDAPVGISDPQQPLGTHFLVAGLDDTRARAEWYGISMESRIPRSVRETNDIIVPDDGNVPATPIVDVLDRITIPADVRLHVSQMLTAGSSLVIADAGTERETGKGTDFIVETGF